MCGVLLVATTGPGSMAIVAVGVASIVLLALALGGLRYAIVHPRHPGRRQLPPLNEDERALVGRLRTHVHAIASRPHNLYFRDALDEAAAYIEQALQEAGFEPLRHCFPCAGHMVRNIEVVIAPPGASPALPTIVMGAHYDSPDDSPGANDNGTGVAALIEIARGLRAVAGLRLRVRLVFFVNEEQPWGKTAHMGSLRHARSLKESGEVVVGMFALETLGHFSDVPGSQRFPYPFGLLYGDRGDFVAFVGLPRARSIVHRAVRIFRKVSPVPSIGGVAPGAIEGIDLSDHWAYDQMGFPACMVTDTAPFRNPYYHQTYDTPDTVDYAMLARVTLGLTAMLEVLATEPPPARNVSAGS